MAKGIQSDSAFQDTLDTPVTEHLSLLAYISLVPYCSTDVQIFAVSFTYMKQKSMNKTSIKKQNFSIDNLSSCFQLKLYGTPGHQKTHFAVCFVSIDPQM